jgi:putative peptidoglycan binding protein
MPRVVVFTLLATALIADPTQSSNSSSSTKSSKSSPSAPKSASAHPATATSRSSTHSSSKQSKRRSRSAAPSYQLHPDPERYRQVQQALADRGYFKGQVSGEWNEDSIDALRRFQADQNIEGDGKITALSLNGLGLGAKHDGSSAATVPLSAASSGTTGDPAATPPSELPAETPPPQ